MRTAEPTTQLCCPYPTVMGVMPDLMGAADERGSGQQETTTQHHARAHTCRAHTSRCDCNKQPSSVDEPTGHPQLRLREDVIVALALNADVVLASKVGRRHGLAHPIPALGLGLLRERATCESREARAAVSGRRRVVTHRGRAAAGHARVGGRRGRGWRAQRVSRFSLTWHVNLHPELHLGHEELLFLAELLFYVGQLRLVFRHCCRPFLLVVARPLLHLLLLLCTRGGGVRNVPRNMARNVPRNVVRGGDAHTQGWSHRRLQAVRSTARASAKHGGLLLGAPFCL